MISDIHHTSFTVSDMERSVAFYRDILGMKIVWDSVQAGAEFKGEIADNLTNCPGTELHIVFLSINERLIELVQYIPPGKALVDNKTSDRAALMCAFRRKTYKSCTRSCRQTRCVCTAHLKTWGVYGLCIFEIQMESYSRRCKGTHSHEGGEGGQVYFFASALGAVLQ